MTMMRDGGEGPGREGDRRGLLGFGAIAGLPAELLRPLARSVSDLGYRAFWINDSARPDADGLAGLAIVQEAAPDLELGVGVVPLDRRDADAIAADVRRLGLPLATLRLGVGSGASDRPLAAVRDGVARLRDLLPEARIYVAALGPHMCRLAGEVADGVLFNWATPDRLNEANAWVDDGAAGRPVERWSYIRATTGEGARDRLRAEAERYAQFPGYGQAFAAQGMPFEQIGIAGEDLDAQLLPYRRLLDGAVVRALPARWELEPAVAIASLAAGQPATGGS